MIAKGGRIRFWSWRFLPVPELPEVETTRCTLATRLDGHTITSVHIWQPRLRWPVPEKLEQKLCGERIKHIKRRAKYLLFFTDSGTLIVHLGMSGSLRLNEAGGPVHPHDRVGWTFDNSRALRLRDPRRFGAVLWTEEPLENHWLLRHLGPEPLEDKFTDHYLFSRSRCRRITIKAFLMDSHIVAGVGNIYASEALHLAGIHPARAAGRISLSRYKLLVTAVRDVLSQAIQAGGTTLRNYVNTEGETGQFRFQLRVYARQGENCMACAKPLAGRVIAGRSTVYCPRCQR